MRDDDSFQLQLECTLFFEENPYTLESSDGLALRLGRKSEHLEAILDRLVTLCILERIGDGPRSIYRYIQPIVTSSSAIEWASP